MVARTPTAIYALLPAEEIPIVTKALHDSSFAFDYRSTPEISAFIITNNIKVTVVAFAGGMTLGVLTIFIILNNGLMLGGLGALFASKGFGDDFLATIAPHGVFELTAIMISGGAGLSLALGVLAPGRSSRADALRMRGRRAAVLMLGVCAMLVVAGTIEGFFTPLRTSMATRALVGEATAMLLFAYLAFAGREKGRSTCGNEESGR